MKANTIPEKPRRVTLALYMLYLSLGISVIIVLLIWRLWGFPGPVVSFLTTYTLLLVGFHAHAPSWLLHADLVIVPIAVWLYFMIGKGRYWARTIVTAFVILGILESILARPLTLSAPTIPGLELTRFLPHFLIGAHIVQGFLKIAAVILLYGRVSSDWFRMVKELRSESNKDEG